MKSIISLFISCLLWLGFVLHLEAYKERGNDSLFLIQTSYKLLTLESDSQKEVYLSNQLKLQTNPKTRIYLLQKLAIAQVKRDIYLAKQTVKTALDHANTAFPTDQIGKEKNNLARLFIQQNEYRLALYVFEQAALHHQKEGKPMRASQSLLNKATVHKNIGDYSNALKIAFDAAAVFDSLGSIKNLATAYNTIGNTYTSMMQYPTALGFHHNALNLRKNLNHEKGVASSFNSLGNVFRYNGQVDSAFYYYHRYLQIGRKLKDSGIIARALDNMGEVFLLGGRKDSARIYFKHALSIQELTGNKHGLVYALNRMSKSLLEDDSLNSAELLASRALAISNQIDTKKELLETYDLLRKVYLKGGNIERYSYYTEQYIRLNKVLFNQRYLKQVAQKDAWFHVTQSKRELQLQKEKNTLHQLNLERQRSFIIWISTGALVVLLLLILSLRLYRRTKIAKLKQEEANVKIGEANRLIKTLMKDLSHRTTNQFQQIISLIDSGLPQVDPKGHDLLEALQLRVHSMGILHTLLHDVYTKGNVNVFSYLNRVLVHLCSVYDIGFRKVVKLHVPEKAIVSTKVALIIASILSEMATNAFKHAFKDNPNPLFSVHFSQKENGHCTLKVGDNGEGSVVKRDGSWGMGIIYEMVSKLSHGKIEYNNIGGVHYRVEFDG